MINFLNLSKKKKKTKTKTKTFLTLYTWRLILCNCALPPKSKFSTITPIKKRTYSVVDRPMMWWMTTSTLLIDSEHNYSIIALSQNIKASALVVVPPYSMLPSCLSLLTFHCSPPIIPIAASVLLDWNTSPTLTHGWKKKKTECVRSKTKSK